MGSDGLLFFDHEFMEKIYNIGMETAKKVIDMGEGQNFKKVIEEGK